MKFINYQIILIISILVSLAQSKAGGGGSSSNTPVSPANYTVNSSAVLPDYLLKNLKNLSMGYNLTK